jgi:DNA-directed RNA polymerase specialized sigma subunit
MAGSHCRDRRLSFSHSARVSVRPRVRRGRPGAAAGGAKSGRLGVTDDPLELIKEAHYQATGKMLTGNGALWNGFCPLCNSRKRKLRITVNDVKVSVNCMAQKGHLSDDILSRWGLTYTDLYRNHQNGLDGKSSWDGIELRREQLRGVKEASKDSPSELYKELKQWSQTLPPDLRDRWEQVLDKDEWASLIALVRERADRRANRDDLSFNALVYAGAQAAAAVSTWEPDRGARLTTYARKPIREAIQKEARRQSNQVETEPLTGDILEIPQRTFGLEIADHPKTCDLCNEPIPHDKPADARFCSDAHRKRYHYLSTREAEDYAEAIEFRYATLPELPEDAPEGWVLDRALLREAVNELSQRRRYWRRLEQWLLAIWDARVSSSTFKDLKAWRIGILDNLHKQTSELMLSPYEMNGDRNHGHRARPRGRTPGGKRAALVPTYEDLEDKFLDEGKDDA